MPPANPRIFFLSFCLCSLAQVHPSINQTCSEALRCPRCCAKGREYSGVKTPSSWLVALVLGDLPGGLEMELSQSAVSTPQ